MWFIKQSLWLDITLIKRNRWPTYRLLELFVKKYTLLIKHMFIKHDITKDYVRLSGVPFYYDSKYGLAGYQACFVRHKSMLLAAKSLNSKPTIIDIGANVGTFTLLCNEMYPRATIYSIEPINEVFDALKKNTAKYKNINCYQCAISNRDGFTSMQYNPSNSAISHISDKGKIRVRTYTLDTFCKTNLIKNIDILKIDTESYEHLVLQKGQHMLDNTKYVHIEVTIKDNKNYTISSLFNLLYNKRHNFQLIYFRNFADKPDGSPPILDCFLKNITYAE